MYPGIAIVRKKTPLLSGRSRLDFRSLGFVLFFSENAAVTSGGAARPSLSDLRKKRHQSTGPSRAIAPAYLKPPPRVRVNPFQPLQYSYSNSKCFYLHVRSAVLKRCRLGSRWVRADKIEIDDNVLQDFSQSWVPSRSDFTIPISPAFQRYFHGRIPYLYSSPTLS